MKSIETEYNWIRYRSRLEARWAVFMDTLGVRHNYEPEAYDLGDGIFYLPDFWLPDLLAFVEIKPGAPTLDESAKASRLAEHTKRDVFVFYGAPELPEFGRGCESAYYFPPDGGEDHEYWWCECPSCHRIDIEFVGTTDRIKCQCPVSRPKYSYDSPRLQSAYLTARAHRFWTPAKTP